MSGGDWKRALTLRPGKPGFEAAPGRPGPDLLTYLLADSSGQMPSLL